MDINKLTLGEIAKVEELSGQSVSTMADDNAPKARLMIALAYVITKRQDPTFTHAQAEAMTMEEIQPLLNGGKSEDNSKSE